MLRVIRHVPNALLAVFALLPPLAIMYRFGQDAILFLAAAIGLLAAWFLYRKSWQKQLFFTLIATLFFSVEIPLLGGAALSLPAEPLALILAPVVVLMIFNKQELMREYVRQPILWAVAALLFSLLLSTAFSGMFLVSVKYVFIIGIYILVGVFAFSQLWQTEGFSLQKVLQILVFPALFFSLFAVYNLLPHRFNPGAASLIGFPFFKDHTVFSATFSLFVPLFLMWNTFKTSAKKTDWLFPAVGVALLFALFISSSRAAWLAILIAAVFYGFVRLGGTLKIFGIGFAMFVLSLWFFADSIEKKLFVNQYTSTESAGGLQDQALSVTNVSSDVSNLERLNRWKSAVAMGRDKPFFGFGPGTYQFEYFPYQRDADKTYISVDSPFNTIVGRGGSAHSEYLLLFSESGFAGMLAWIALQIALLFSFFNIWNGDLEKRDKNLALATYLGVLTYTVHSLFNNFLNSVQFGISYWMLVGALVYLAMKNRKHVA